MSQFEDVPAGVYGLPARGAFGKLFGQGCLFGFCEISVLIGLIAAFGGYSFGSLAEHGATIGKWALYWGSFFVVVGLFEEFLFRGYTLHTLAEGLGFWPAAVILSLLFVSDHYFFKTGENLYDVVTLFTFGMFICLSVRRTGTLWFGVGFHIAFDFMQLFVIGTRNGALTPVGSLFVSQFPGPAWVNGGVLGTEASVLVYPLMILMYVYLLRRYPRDQALIDPPEDINLTRSATSP